MPPNPQRKLPLHATRPADRTLQGRHSSLIEQGAVTECERQATTATVPTRMSATVQAREPGGTRSPAPLKASQLPMIRPADLRRNSLPSDNGSPPIAN
jgi:hypothetical protein